MKNCSGYKIGHGLSGKKTICFLIVLVGCVLFFGPVSTEAADNQATGDISGNGALLTDSNTLTLNVTQLALRKQARDTGGSVLAAGADVTSGQEIYFVIYVDNTTAVPAIDVQITDLIDETEFTYVADSIEYTTVATGSDDAAIWAGTWTALTDDLAGPDDLASCENTGGPADRDKLTIGQVATQANQQLDISGSTLWALRIKVTVN